MCALLSVSWQLLTRILLTLQMMKFAWDNYKRYAWGKNELRPLTKNGHIGNMFGEFQGFSYAFTCQEMSLWSRHNCCNIILRLEGCLKRGTIKNHPHFSNETWTSVKAPIHTSLCKLIWHKLARAQCELMVPMQPSKLKWNLKLKLKKPSRKTDNTVSKNSLWNRWIRVLCCGMWVIIVNVGVHRIMHDLLSSLYD